MLPRLASLIDDAAFRAAFENKEPMRAILRDVDTRLITGDNAALIGMAVSYTSTSMRLRRCALRWATSVLRYSAIPTAASSRTTFSKRGPSPWANDKPKPMASGTVKMSLNKMAASNG